jgi:Carboxypeptidase regulatory-like domain
MKTKLRYIAVVVTVALALAWCVPGVGQVLKGSISGTVVDPQGAVVSAAQVQAKNVETGVVASTTSDNSGLFRLNLLPAGTYNVDIGAKGFKTAAAHGWVVNAGVDTGMGNVRLTVGETSTTVEVTATAPLMETTQAQVTNTFSGVQLNNFAGIQENEGLDRLALFVPGVVASRSDNFSNTNGIGFSSNGLRGRNNDQEIDGQNNNDNSVGGPGLFLTDINFVGQYVIVTNNFGPEYGRNAGSVVNIITKSGSNTWHGSVYGDETNSYLNALSNTQKNFSTNPVTHTPGLTGPPRSNQEFTGGTIGGPILHNKAFLFSGFDDQLFEGKTLFSTGSLALTPAGLATVAACPGINPTALNFLENFGPYAISGGGPSPTGAHTVTIGTCPGVQVGGVSRTIGTPGHQFNWVERADVNLGSDTITSRYIYNRNNNFNNNDSPATGYAADTLALSQAVLVSWTHNLSARMVNEARVSFSRLGVEFGGNTLGSLEPADGNIQQALTNVSFQAGGFATLGPATNFPQGRIVNTWQGQDNWNYVLGKHALKAGVNFTYQRSPNTFLPDINGQFRFASMASFLTSDIPNRILIANGNPILDFREYDTFLYAGDDWKIAKSLTLNLGLTWTYYGQPANLFNSVSTARENGPGAFWSSAVPLADRTNPNIPTVMNSFGPSVGFAYSPQWGGFLTGHGKTVIRGGYRLLYDPPVYNIFLNTSSSAPFVFLQTITDAASLNANPLPLNPVGPTVRSQLQNFLGHGIFDPRTFTQTTVSPNFGPDKVNTWSFGFERELSRNSAVEVRYVGNHATNLFQTVDGNPYVGTAASPGLAQSFPNLVPSGVTGCTAPQVIQTPTQALTAPNPALGREFCDQGLVGQRNNGAYSNYEALQTEFRASNLAKQLFMRASYTWSKNLDNSSEIFSTGTAGNTLTVAQNPFNTTSGEYSISGLNVPNAFTVELTEYVPFFREQHGLLGHLLGGWGLAGSYILASGQPYTPLQIGEALATTPFGNVYDSAFVAAFAGVDSARPFFGSLSAPANTVGIFASDLCRSFLGGAPSADPTFEHRPGACNTLLTPANALLSFNAMNVNPATGGTGQLIGPGTQVSATNPGPGSIAPQTVNTNQVRYIINGGMSQSMFGTPFGNVSRNAISDAIQNIANVEVFKNFKLGERAGFEIHLSAINAFNHFNFASVDPELEDASRIGSSTGFANPAVSTANGRQVFIGGRLTF